MTQDPDCKVRYLALETRNGIATFTEFSTHNELLEKMVSDLTKILLEEGNNYKFTLDANDNYYSLSKEKYDKLSLTERLSIVFYHTEGYHRHSLTTSTDPKTNTCNFHYSTYGTYSRSDHAIYCGLIVFIVPIGELVEIVQKLL